MCSCCFSLTAVYFITPVVFAVAAFLLLLVCRSRISCYIWSYCCCCCLYTLSVAFVGVVDTSTAVAHVVVAVAAVAVVAAVTVVVAVVARISIFSSFFDAYRRHPSKTSFKYSFFEKISIF